MSRITTLIYIISAFGRGGYSPGVAEQSDDALIIIIRPRLSNKRGGVAHD